MALPKDCKVEAMLAMTTVLCSQGAGGYVDVNNIKRIAGNRSEGLPLCGRRVKSWKLEVRQFLLALVY